MPCSAASSCRLIAVLICTSVKCGGSWATPKRTETISRRFEEWGTCLRGRRRRRRNNNNEKPFPQDFSVILGRPGAVSGAGDSGDDCRASGAAWDREPGSANFGGGGGCVSEWWRARRP